MDKDEVKQLVKEAMTDVVNDTLKTIGLFSGHKARYPLKYGIYRGVNGKQGAIKFELMEPYKSDKKVVGAVFVTAAKATGPNKYDWDNATVFALSPDDIGHILYQIRTNGKVSIFHDPDAQTPKRGTRDKKLDIARSDKDKHKYFLSLSEKKHNNYERLSLLISGSELMCVTILLEQALPQILAWRR